MGCRQVHAKGQGADVGAVPIRTLGQRLDREIFDRRAPRGALPVPQRREDETSRRMYQNSSATEEKSASDAATCASVGYDSSTFDV